MNALFFRHTFGNRYGGNAPWLWGVGIYLSSFISAAMKILRAAKKAREDITTKWIHLPF
jgi:hypothetical protein